ncbi:hypothetical protein NPX13_g5550 [Xylaria arbuscula]|uniref:Uncharacterized protein n=1 Tax=Xylaria arbuscula TaxID=114810 RepID=A0A9W8TML6_9PEZI|nr:hypothetical protein NPX13_g5550 [Xylaria arbuscula]
MRASEWQFLCAVHDQPKSCCAIDYCCHTLDWAANVVTNPKIFPSRFVLVSEGHDKGAVLRNLVNVFRRLHRIFAHAWFQHREVFWSVESRTGLYAFFKTVCDMYDLLPAENYKLPPEAEGLEHNASNKEEKRHTVTAIAKSSSHHNGDFEPEDDRNNLHARRSNTARHSSRPSTGSAVTTVIEEGEDEHSEVTDKLRGMHITTQDVTEEESGVEVPVIVEGDIRTDAQTDESSGTAGDSGQAANEPAGEQPESADGTNITKDPTSPEEDTSQISNEQTTEDPEPTAEDGDEPNVPTTTDSASEEAPSSITDDGPEKAAELSSKEGEDKPDLEDSSTG